MLRVTILVTGCVLALIGCGLVVYGYQASRPQTPTNLTKPFHGFCKYCGFPVSNAGRI